MWKQSALAAAAAVVLAVAGLAVGSERAFAQMPTGNSTPAPIEDVAVAQVSGEWVATVKSGLPSGCAKFGSIAMRQSGTVFDITVTNVIDVPPGGACTMIYGMATNSVKLAGNLQSGVTYQVVVNRGTAQSRETSFTVGQTATPASTPVSGAGTGPERTCPECPPNTSSGPMPANTGNAGLLGQQQAGLAVLALAVVAFGAVVGVRAMTRQ